jgi:CBS domain-containing protein
MWFPVSYSIAQIYKNDIANHKVLLSKEIKSNALKELQEGRIPKLEALNTHTGSIYRWNRPCYGVGNGKPHLRIETRYLPAGPTIQDQMANFAFWVGLMLGRPRKYNDMESQMDFRDVKANFIKAARTGKETILDWNDKLISARDLCLQELLPIAYSGLEKANIEKEEINHLLGTIEGRAKGHTGAQWSIRSFRKLRKKLRVDESLLEITKAMYRHQEKGKPVHEWPVMRDRNPSNETAHFVGHIMTSRIFTVFPTDLASLALKIMKWRNIHHMPVEDENGKLCGLLTWTHMQRLESVKREDKTVADIMTQDVIYADYDMPIENAIKIFLEEGIGCLPIVHHDHLVGIVTANDLKNFVND